MKKNKSVLRFLWSLFLFIALLITVGCAEQFSFVIIADPHIDGTTDHEDRLAACVEWVNMHQDEEQIELVLVVGDIGWGNGNLARAKQILDGLALPYIPLIGDNEVESGYEEDYHITFEPQYSDLAAILDNWQKTPTPVWDPEINDLSYLQNFSFDHKGVHFMGIDWCTRAGGESAELHDFPGGTWPWFTEDITNCSKEIKENIVMTSHLPMHYNVVYEVFSAEEDGILETFTGGYGDYVYANLAGHYHFNWYEPRLLGKYEIFVTDATWDDENTLRVITVKTGGTTFFYNHQLITIPLK